MRRWLGVACAAALVAAARPAMPSTNARAIPSRASVTVKPGEPVARDVTIANDGDVPVVVRVRLADWALDARGELTLLAPGATANSLQGWISYEPSEFSLAAGASGVIHVTLRMPPDGPATRWGLLLSEVRPTTWSHQGLGPRAIAELGTTLYASRVPADRIRGELTGMAVGAEDSAMAVTLALRNPGERHLYASGRIAVRDSTGRQVADADLGTGVVLPGMERLFTWKCPTPLGPGRYTVTATMDTGEPELIVGETVTRWPPHLGPRLIAGDGGR